MTYRLLLSLMLITLILTGLSCGRGDKNDQAAVSDDTGDQEQRASENQGFVPPPPELISEFEQEGYTEEEKDYLNSIKTAPNSGSDPLREELGF